MRTMELLPEIGGHILENTEDITVDVHNPDVNVRVEIRSGYSYIMCDERMGSWRFTSWRWRKSNGTSFWWY